MRFNGSLIALSSLTILAAACSAASNDEGATKDEETTGTQASAWSTNDHDGRYERGDDRDCDGRGTSRVHAKIIATGIPGAGAIAQIGAFLRSSPFHDKAAFLPYSAPGAVVDGARILVASSSNFGAPRARTDQYEGTVLSIDPNGGNAFAVPKTFAAAGGQASAVSGAVQVYAANNAAFLNSIYEPQAVTANEVSASLPLGISLNNGNGRPWLANSPMGAKGPGTITVLDPYGAPLAGAPYPVAGGVFSGSGTNRAGATHGLEQGSVGTAIITKSSDNTGKAVFASVQADGSIVQVDVLKGVNELAPPGTITKFRSLTPAAAESVFPWEVTRAGIAFNWVPNRTLYVTDPQADRVYAIDITADGTLFHAGTPRSVGRRGDFDIPIDIQPTMPEVGSENFASNSTLAGGADLYVLNRGDNTIVRVNQVTGAVMAREKIIVDGHPFWRANGIGVSPDGKSIYVTGQTLGGGLVARIDAFGVGDLMGKFMDQAAKAGAKTKEQLGSFFFNKTFGLKEGVGPLFNEQSCVSCHGEPVPGGMSDVFEEFFAKNPHDAGEVARAHSVSEIGGKCGLPVGPPRIVSSSSTRSSMSLRSTSLIDFVQGPDILHNMAAEPEAIRGRPNYLSDGRIGRFGWKANVATLVEFMGDAFRNEQGLTNSLQPQDLETGCNANADSPELDSRPLGTTPAFLTTIDAPAPTAACLGSAGAAVFHSTGCDGCHKASFPGPGFTAYLYSDILLHDMGKDLADGFTQASATGTEFRTMTLVKLNERSHFLHDGRANTPQEAIAAHGGQAATSQQAFTALSPTDKTNLLGFLGCL